MKFIWLSVAPWAVTGYGLVTKELVPRIVKEGHEVTIATKHAHTGCVEWNGCDVISGTDVSMLNRMIEKGEADYIITLLDNHVLTQTPLNWISYCPFDTEKLPNSIARYLEYIKLLIALTRHGQAEFKEAGYDSFYAPHGVDPTIYKPDEKNRNENRERLGWEDNFIIGTVGVNYPDDRKSLVNLMRAFSIFHGKHKKARLYMVTNHVDEKQAFPIPMIAHDLGITEYMALSSEDEYLKGKVTDSMMANRYGTMDVMCMPTKGEGFGLPLIEAQACGTPVVTTNASTGPELLKGGGLIEVGKYDWEYFNKSWRANVRVESIVKALEKSYKAWTNGTIRDIGFQASEVIRKDYDWDSIFDTYWKPILKEITNLKVKVKTTPNYRTLYKAFGGRIAMADCGAWCKNRPCDHKYPLLQGEPPTDRPIMSRSYPVLPGGGGSLYVDTTCPLHGWLSKRFTKDVRDVWKELYGYPLIRQAPVLIPKEAIPLDGIKHGYDESYKWAMQTNYYTICPDLTPFIPEGSKVLEVGCGDGKRVKELRDRGVDAIGMEVNESQEQHDLVVIGDAEHLTYQDNSFDVVLSIDVLEHLDNPLRALGEMFRVSRDKVIAILTPLECKEFMEDPTHKVEWGVERWKRELNEFGEITDALDPFGFVVKKNASK